MTSESPCLLNCALSAPKEAPISLRRLYCAPEKSADRYVRKSFCASFSLGFAYSQDLLSFVDGQSVDLIAFLVLNDLIS
ncbi:hypothetical protein L596_011717 [Steinernema carpocapsae]|uniref:Uncharacterized protein n=1 Tax=Steinernema carpocapsae TaxID=34508 RepID=A0A4U5NVK6_STECR|nr:hypothetical protein L596_011717 [Steinernema carpocapsae]